MLIMNFHRYLRRLRESLPKVNRKQRPGPSRFRPWFEVLEDRTVPTTLQITVNNNTPFTLAFDQADTQTNILSGVPSSLPPGTTTFNGDTGVFLGGVDSDLYFFIGNTNTKVDFHAHVADGGDPGNNDTYFQAFQPIAGGFFGPPATGSGGFNPNVTYNVVVDDAARNFPLNSSSWTAIDPGAMFTNQTPGPADGTSPPTVSGRVTGLAVDPTTDTIFAATAGGGVWQDVSNSTGNTPDSPVGNSAGDWMSLTDSLKDSASNPIPLFMGAIAVAPSTPQRKTVIYAGTGEANNSGDSYWGEGILVSQDGGQNWTLTGPNPATKVNPFLRTAISKIVIDPQDPNTAWAAVSESVANGNAGGTTGIYKGVTIGGVTTWTLTTAAIDTTDPWSDLVIDPTTTTKNGGKAILYAAVGNSGGSASNNIYQSLDSGATWTPVAGVPGIVDVAMPGVTVTGRIGLALSHPMGANATLYASIGDANGNLQAFDVATISNNGLTVTWAQQNTNANPNLASFPNYLNGVGWYGNVIVADPNTPSLVYAAGAGNGTTIVESSDSGATWTDLTTGGTNKVVPHADHHALAVDGTGRLLDGNDGGVWRLDADNHQLAPNAVFTWEALNGWETLNAPGLSINQIHGIALSPASSQVILSGSQDNGTNIFKGGQSAPFVSAWTNGPGLGNDGGFVRIDPAATSSSNPITAFTTYQYSSVLGFNFMERIDDLGNKNTVTDITGSGSTGLGLNSIQTVSNVGNPTITTTAANDGYLVGQAVNISSVVGAKGVNGSWIVTTTPSPNQFTLAPRAFGVYTGGAMVTTTTTFAFIMSITNVDNPTITTTTPHGLSIGQAITISGATGATGVNGSWVVATIPSMTQFTLAPAAPGAYISGGTVSDPGDFYPPYVIDPNNQNQLVLGLNRLYTTTVQAISGWSPLGTFLPGNPAIDSIAVAPGDSKTIYVGAGTNIFVTHDSGATWKNVTPMGVPFAPANSFPGSGVFRNIVATDSMTAYVLVGAFTTGNVGRIWLTTTGGTSWNDITGMGLPTVPAGPAGAVLGVPIDSMVLLPAENATVVGTDVGVYFTNNVNVPMPIWSPMGSGLPNVQVTDLETMSYPDTGGDMLAAGTYGRGVWEIQFVTFITLDPTNGDLMLKGNSLGGSFTFQLKAGDSSTLQVYQGSTLLKEFPVSSVKQIHVSGSGGTNTLTLNFSNGNLIPGGGVNFNGGGVTSTLVLKGQLPSGPFGNELDAPTGPHSGTLTLDGSTITYTNLKPIIDTVLATNLTIKGTSNPDQINIVDDPNGTENGFQATEVNSPSFEKIEFANKSNVTVDGVDGADTFKLNYTNPAAGLNNLVVVTGPTDGSVVNVQSIPSGVITSIQSKAATTVNVGSLAPASSGIADQIGGSLVVTNNVSKGTLNVDDTGSTGAKTGFLTNNMITGLNMAGGITYSGMMNVNVNLGSGNDVFNIQSTSAITTINGGAANDVFNVGTLAPASGGYLAQLSGKLFLNGASGGTSSLVIDDQLDPAAQTYTLTSTTFASPISALVTYSQMNGIGVNGGTGNDTLVVDSSGGLVTVANGINYNGGTAFNTLQLAQTGGPTRTSDTYSVGPNPGMGTSTISDASGTQTVFFQNLAPVTDLVPVSSLTVNGTPSNNAFSYGVGSLISRGLVSIDNFEPIEFANKANLFLNSGRGTDTFSLNDSNTPTGLISITVTGGDPSANDSLVVNGAGSAVTVNTAGAFITGAGGAGGAIPINYNGIGNLSVVEGGSTTLAISGSHTYAYTPATALDGGAIQTDTLPISFSHFGAGTTLALTGLGVGTDSLTVNGTAGADTFTAAATSGNVTLAARTTIVPTAIPKLTLNGQDGGDTFNATGPQPYTSITLVGGGALAGDTANLTGNGTSNVTADLSGANASVTGGGLGSISLPGIQTINLTVGAANFTLKGTTGGNSFTVTPGATTTRTGGTAPVVKATNTGTVMLDGVSSSSNQLLVTVPAAAAQATYTPTSPSGGTLAASGAPVTFTNIQSFTYDGQSGGDTLTMVGNAAANLFTLRPGAGNDAGILSMDSTLPVTFQNLGTSGQAVVNGNGGADTLLYFGAAANDTFTVASNPLGGQVNLNARVPVITEAIPTLTLQGVAGSDTFTLVPTLATSPYTTLNLQAGNLASGDQANLTAAAGADVSVTGQVVSQSGKSVAGSGLANINLNGAGNRLIYNGVAGVTENINVMASTTANRGQVSVPGVTLVTFVNVPIIAVNGQLADGDTVTFTGTNNQEIYQINLAAAGTAADPVLKLQTTTGATLLTLQNYTGFQTLNIAGLSGADTFNVYTSPTAPGGGRQIFINEQLPAGKKKLTAVLNVFYVFPKPKIVHSTSTQDPDAGLVSLNYGTDSFLIQFDGIPTVTISKQ
jgi:hypothetical protein